MDQTINTPLKSGIDKGFGERLQKIVLEDYNSWAKRLNCDVRTLKDWPGLDL